MSNSNHILTVYYYNAHKAVIDSSAIPRANVAKATRRNGFAFVHMWVAVLSIHTHVPMLLKDKQPSRQGSEDAHRTCMHVSDSSSMQASPSVSLAIYDCHTFDNYISAMTSCLSVEGASSCPISVCETCAVDRMQLNHDGIVCS